MKISEGLAQRHSLSTHRSRSTLLIGGLGWTSLHCECKREAGGESNYKHFVFVLFFMSSIVVDSTPYTVLHCRLYPRSEQITLNFCLTT